MKLSELDVLRCQHEGGSSCQRRSEAGMFGEVRPSFHIPLPLCLVTPPIQMG